MQSKLTRAEFTILAAGIALVVGSFAPFYSAAGISVNAWDSFLSPIALYPVFAGAASAGVVALRHFANAQLAVRLGSFTWEQVHVLLGLLALLITGGYFFKDRSGLTLRPRVLAAARRVDRALRRRADAVARARRPARLPVAPVRASRPRRS